MAAPIVIELLGAPEAKGRPRSRLVETKAGKRFIQHYTPQKTQGYEGALKVAAEEAMEGRTPLDGPLAVVVTASFPIPASWSGRQKQRAAAGLVRPTGRPDWENVAKMLDALNQVVWRDDAQIVDGHVIKIYADRPSLRIEVRPVEVLPLIAATAAPPPREADAAPLFAGVA